MSEESEQDYINGSKAAWLEVLRTALRHLGVGEFTEARLVAEREEAILVLRRICKDHGDNDWADDLHLADVLDKHLGRHLTDDT